MAEPTTIIHLDACTLKKLVDTAVDQTIAPLVIELEQTKAKLAAVREYAERRWYADIVRLIDGKDLE